MTELVQVEREGPVGILTLNDPPKRNAFSRAMREGIIAALVELNTDPDVRVIIVTGAGGTFCSGGDITEMEPRTQLVMRERLVMTTDVTRLMLKGPKPIVAAVEGAVVGAGVGVAAATDYCVCASNARLAFAFLRMGLLPDAATYWSIPRRVGLAKAQELFGLAKTIDGAEAARIGLVNEVVEPGQALARAREIAADYVQMAPVPMAILRGALAEGFASFDAAVEFELVAQPLIQRTLDHREAVAAFREKRQPVFKGD